MPSSRKTIRDIQALKLQNTPIVCLTAYTAPITKLLDPHVDILLVGDTLGMIVYGFETTLPVTLDMMISHGETVVRCSQKACVVVDMPFGSYQASKEEAFRNASRLLQETGCAAVKMEGGSFLAETIHYLTERGIPVMGHIGLLPQSVHATGLRYQGRNEEDIKRIENDAKCVQDAGAFALVAEGVKESIGRKLAETLTIPVIGIGASPACDGQVLVVDDMLGLFTDFTPSFVKQYASLASSVENAVKDYARDVRARTFPSLEHCFGTKK